MRNLKITNDMFIENRYRFTLLMTAKHLVILGSAEKMPRNGDQFFPFRQQSDFFYLTGIQNEKASLLMFPDCPNPAFREVLFIEDYDEQKAIWEGHQLNNEEAVEISGIKQIMPASQLEMVLKETMNYASGVILTTMNILSSHLKSLTTNRF